MIEIEFEKPNYTTCECCGNQVTWLTRFVYKDNEAIAFYYATFTEHTEKKEVKCLIGICEWENPESEEYIIGKSKCLKWQNEMSKKF